MKKLLALSFLLGMVHGVHADFRKEGGGWVYNDHGDHKARTHVIQALTKAKSIPTPTTFMPSHVNFYLEHGFTLAMSTAGIGKEEIKPWFECCMKGGNLLAGIMREIGWISRSDPERGIFLHFTKGQWHCDHRE